MNTKKYKWIAGCLCALPLVVSAQQTEPLTDHRRLFDDGKELFLRHDYAAAQQTLMQYVKQNPQADTSDEVAYMLTCTAYELNASDRLEQLEKFLDTYPDSRHRNRVQALLASAYFFQEKYLETIATFKGCDLELLSNEERDVCTLRMATAYQKIGNLQEASMWFSILKEVSENSSSMRPSTVNSRPRTHFMGCFSRNCWQNSTSLMCLPSYQSGHACGVISIFQFLLVNFV